MRFLIPVLLTFLITGCRQSHLPADLNSDIDSIVHKWVPDTREGICTVNISMLSSGKVLAKGETSASGAKAEIINYLGKSGYGYLDSIIVLPDPKVVKRTWGLISLSVCNIKKSPSHSSELVSQAIMGTPVKILKKKGGWLLIQTPDYYIGWANSSGISEFTEQEMARWRQSQRVLYIRKSGDILSDAGTNRIVSDIVAGAIVEMTALKNGKCSIILPDGRKGVLNSADIKDFKGWSLTTFPEPEAMILFSKTLLGLPYLWGGTSTKAFDCSGFVKTIYFTAGLILARDASQQFLYGKLVEVTPELDLLKKGDLIFFGNEDEGKKRITHVGMYIGDTEVIHCSGMVRINSLDSTRSDFSKYLKDSLIGVKRIIGTESGKGSERIADNSWYCKS
jgi:SH3-like domain-containing protein